MSLDMRWSRRRKAKKKFDRVRPALEEGAFCDSKTAQRPLGQSFFTQRLQAA